MAYYRDARVFIIAWNASRSPSSVFLSVLTGVRSVSFEGPQWKALRVLADSTATIQS